MGEIRLDHCCRLCLKEGFSLTNIFSHRSAAGDPLYCILNFIYEMKIFENDGLPSQICSPCMWRMIEFDACKRNVRSAEAEIMRLLNQTRPHPDEVHNDSLVTRAEETEMEEASEVGVQCDTDHSEHQIPESVQHLNEDDYYELKSREVEPVEVSAEEYEEKCYETVFCQPLRDDSIEGNRGNDETSLESDSAHSINIKDEIVEWVIPKEMNRGAMDIESTGSSDIKNFINLEASEESVGNLFEGVRSSIFSTQGISDKNRGTNKGIHGKYLRDNVVPEEASVSAKQSKSILNLTKLEMSHSQSPLSMTESGFICNICKKSFIRKDALGYHVRVHYDERPFSCTICDKRFKLDRLRQRHELIHLRDKMSFGKSVKGSKIMLFSCAICAKNFSSKRRLSAHSNVHSDKYRCNYCGKHFSNNGNLSSHLRILHTKEKPFECDVCFKCFSTKSNLNSHVRIHSSEKPFSCEICDKKFKRNSDKVQHELQHLRKNNTLNC